MRWLLGLFLLLSIAVTVGYIFIKGYPYRLYSQWVIGKEWNKYYELSNYRSSILAPIEIETIPPYEEDYGQLWREFPLRNARVPLPIRHPMFQVVPIIEPMVNKSIPRVGIKLLAATGRELSRIITLPTGLYQDFSQGQELFKLPFVRNRILKFPIEKLWKDVFSYKIDVESKSMDKMIYDLYLLHIRTKVLPEETIRFGLIHDGNVALVELESPDKDYMIELVMTFDNGNVYSYALKTEKNNLDSRKLRSKFLNQISFTPIDPAVGKILYTEFKQLNYVRQVDQEGMLYLFSAWSQDTDNGEMLKEMIFYLERGRSNGQQLKPLYQYALGRYGKTYTIKNTFSSDEDPNLNLQRKIELEDNDAKKAAAGEKNNPVRGPELTPDERMHMYLKKAKESVPEKNKDMTIH